MKGREGCNHILNNAPVYYSYLLCVSVCLCVFSEAVIHGLVPLCGFEVQANKPIMEDPINQYSLLFV